MYFLQQRLRITRVRNLLKVRRRDLLHYREFRSLLIGQTVSQIGDAVGTVLLANLLLFTNDNGPTVSRLIALVLTSAAPLVLAGPIGGAIADRFTRRGTLVVGHLIRTATIIVALVGAVAGIDVLTFLMWAAGLCLSRILYTARAASMRHVVRNHELVAADSFSFSMGAFSGTIGGSCGLFLSNFVGPSSLALVAAMHLLAAYVFRGIKVNLGGGRNHVTANWGQLLHHLRAPKIRFTILAASSLRACFGMFFAAVVLIGDDYGEGSKLSYIGALGACGFGSFLGNFGAEYSNERMPRRALSVLSFVVSASVVLSAALINHPRIYLIAVVLTSAIFQNLRVCSDATVQSNAISGAGGREFALYDVGHGLAFLMGILFGLSLSSIATHHVTVITSGILFFSLAPLFMMMQRTSVVIGDKRELTRTI